MIGTLINPARSSRAASALRPMMTDAAMDYLSLMGNMRFFCGGINLVWGGIIRAANLLPAVIFAAAASFPPIRF